MPSSGMFHLCDDIDNCRSEARIVEFDNADPTVVFDLLVEDADPMSQGFIVNQVERLSAVYGADVAVVTR